MPPEVGVGDPHCDQGDEQEVDQQQWAHRVLGSGRLTLEGRAADGERDFDVAARGP